MPERPPKSTKAASSASKTLGEGRTRKSKAAAGSALSQKEKKGTSGKSIKDSKK